MKVFLKYFAIPLLIAVVASALYVIDALIGGLFVDGKGFMWVAFASWTVFFGASIKERIKGFIGIIIGFISAILMNLITSSFSLNIGTISISCLLGVFILNGAVMYMNHANKIWLNSVTGAFVGIFLTFSGLGCGLSPIASVNESLLMLGILLTYSVLGLMCGYISITCQNKIKDKLESLDTTKQVK